MPEPFAKGYKGSAERSAPVLSCLSHPYSVQTVQLEARDTNGSGESDPVVPSALGGKTGTASESGALT